MLRKVITLAAVIPALWACDSVTDPAGAGEVAVRFRAVAPTSGTASAISASRASFDHVPATDAITITGTNGTLVIHDIRVIVSEIELERPEGECLGENDDDCEEFEGGPFLASLLGGGADEVVRALVPAGTYTELEFEVEDLDLDDDDDSSERQAKEAILAELRQTYPNFPSDASMVVHGTFDGEPFTVYFDAEIEIEQEFETPFRVPEDGAIIVSLSPALWFAMGDQVMDLRALDGQTIEFEAEFEDGILEIEFDD